MNKKSQESRTDMAVMYAICLMLIVLTVGTLYEIGVLGEIRSSLHEDDTITEAAVEDTPEEDLVIFINNSNNDSVDTNG